METVNSKHIIVNIFSDVLEVREHCNRIWELLRNKLFLEIEVKKPHPHDEGPLRLVLLVTCIQD